MSCGIQLHRFVFVNRIEISLEILVEQFRNFLACLINLMFGIFAVLTSHHQYFSRFGTMIR